jgi:RimJ/RimL family protein N-acetyltransferase
MSANNGKIPDLTIQAICRAFYREASSYGFAQVDYVKFVNALLDLAMKGNLGATESKPDQPAATAPTPIDQAGDVYQLPLRGDQVVVRQFDAETDMNLFDRWLADKFGRYFLLSRTTSERLDIREVAHSDNNVIGIITLPDGNPVGSVSFLDVDPIQRKAELRKIIGDPDQRRKGLAKEASILWIRYGIEGLGLRKIYLNTLNTDLRNIKLNEELGFTVEGVLRNEVLIDGTYHDVLRMGLWQD